MTEELYHELILQHAQQSPHQGTIASADWSLELSNPLCGDKIRLDVRLAGEIVTEAKFSGSGCAISQAAASMLIEQITGKTRPDVLSVIEAFRSLINGRLEHACPEDCLGELVALRGVSKFPARHRCALLACEGLANVMDADSKREGIRT